MEYMILQSFAAQEDFSRWYPLHDGVMGGISEGGLSPIDTTLGLGAKFKGTIRDEYNGGFATVRKSVKWDGSNFNGIFLDINSADQQRIYSVNLKDSICTKYGSNFKSKFRIEPEWSESYTRILLPFTSFSAEFRGRAITREPLVSQNIEEIAIMASKPIGDFELNILNIGFYREMV
jgi:hypothetical protein